MSLTVQNLRAVGTGVEPASLLPGQIAFNITDKVMYVGDGSSFKTDFEGNQVAGVPGAGWYAMPMDFGALGNYYVANPEVYGDVPTDQQVLTWSTALNHPLWTTGSGGGGNQVYVVTNAQVASASGATTSDKITTAIGVASPDEGDVTIVTGLPDDVYEGLYFFTTSWVKGAAYAYPSASEVIYNNTGRTIGATVQAAISDLDDGLIATTAIANTANSTANSALSIASAALPRAGGVMTGNITFQNAGQGVVFNGGSSISAASDSVSTTSSTTSASSTAVKTAYDLAAAAVPRSSFASSGDLLVGTGAGTFSPLPAGAADYILASDGAGNLVWVPDSEGDVTSVAATAPITVNNTNPQVPVIGVNLATTSTPGVVQIDVLGHISLVGGVIGVPASTTANKGVVQLNNTVASTSVLEALTAAQGKVLQDQIDALTFANSVTLAGGYNATTGLVDGATSQGNAVGFFDGFAPPAPAPGNLDYYLICTTAGPLPSTMQNGDWLLSDGTQYVVLGVGARPQSASYTQAGIVQLADAAAVLLGTSDTTAITPEALQDNVLDSVTTANSNQIASSTAVKTAYDAAVAAQTTANAALPKAGGTMTGNITFQDAGEGVIFSDLSSVIAISDSVSTPSATTAASSNAAKTAYDAGVQGQTDAAAAQADADQALLDAAAAQATADVAVPCASFLAQGDLLGGTAAGTYSALTVGSNGQVLLANSACSTGLEWGNADYVPDACFTAAGQLIVGTGVGTYVALPIGTSGQSLVVDLTCTATGGLKWGQSLVGYTCTATPFNTALGQNAGDSVTTGVNNTSLGYNAGTAITGGNNNTFVGFNAGDSTTTSDNNTALGSNALCGGGVNNNTGIGYNTGAALTTGGSNTFVGAAAGDNATTTDNSVAVGYNALGAVATANGTVAVGANAGTALTSGANTTLVGFNAGDSITTGARNTVVGHTSGGALTTGADNTIIGALAANLNTGTGSTILGACAGAALTLGGANVFLGAGAGDLVTTGFNNTIIGDVGGSASLTGNLILAAGTTIKFQANASGAWSPDGTNFGTIGQVLASNGTVAAPSWCTLSLACIPCAAFVACGDLLVGTGSATFTALPTGTNGQSLVVDTTCTATGGMKWVTTPQLCGLTCTATPFNTALGSLAGAALTVNSVANTAIGYAALDAETSGDFNVAIGHNALTAQNGATGNTAIGGNAGSAITTGSSNTLMGSNAGDALTNGAQNTAIGVNSLGTNVSGTSNVAIGSSSLQSSTSSQNTAVGNGAGCSVTIGTGHVYVGYLAGANSTSSCNNTFVGWNSGGLTTGACNTFIGNNSGSAVTTGSCNTLVGRYTGTASLANNVVLSDGAGNIKLQVNENGAVGVGTTPGYGTAGQVLTSAGTAAAPTWSTPQTLSTTATKATTNGTPINLLSWTGATVRMGTLTLMMTDNTTNVAWANITIASDNGIGSSAITTFGGNFGTFSITAGGSGETFVTFTPTATLASVNAVYKYTVSFGAQPTVL